MPWFSLPQRWLTSPKQTSWLANWPYRFFAGLCWGLSLLLSGGSLCSLAEVNKEASSEITLELQKTFATVRDSSQFSPEFDAQIRQNLKTHQARGEEVAAEPIARLLVAHPAAGSELQLLAREIQVRAAARQQNWLEVATLLPARVAPSKELRWLATLQMVCYQAILAGEVDAADALLARSQTIPATPGFAEELRARQARLGLLGRAVGELKLPNPQSGAAAGWCVVSFWSTTCRPCLEELPHLREFEQTLARSGDQLFGIALENSQAVLDRFLEKRSLNWPNELATPEILRANRISTIPCLFLVDPTGRMAATDVPLEELSGDWNRQKELLTSAADRR